MEKCERIRRMKRCIEDKLDLEMILDEYSFAIINDIAQSTNVSLHYIFLTTLIALCHWTMGATLRGAQSYNIPLILFGILCGGSGSKKSAPIRIVKEACEAVDALDGIPVKKSSINASVNMESLCCELEQQSNLLQLWDELAVFLGLFGSTRVDRAAYDRGLMCELYNPTGIVRRQLVSRHNIMIKPRLNIVAAGHPKRIIDCLTGVGLKCQDQKDQHEDGLFNRFLIAIAYKHRPNRELIEPNNKIPKLGHLFYLTKKLHANTEEYSYNEEAKKFIKEVIYNYDILSSDKSNDDDFLASCYQKSMERIERLSLALHIFKICSFRLFRMMDKLQSFASLNDQFKLICSQEELFEPDHLIDYETCFRASVLTKFYLNQTKILAGYDPVTDNILLNKKYTGDIPEAEVNHIKQYIENHPSDRLLLSSLPANLKRKISKDQYLSILRQMETEGTGKIEETTNTTGPKAIVFTKKKKTEHVNRTSLINKSQTNEPSSSNNHQGNQDLSTNRYQVNEASSSNIQQQNQRLPTTETSLLNRQKPIRRIGRNKQQATQLVQNNQQQGNETSTINEQRTNVPYLINLGEVNEPLFTNQHVNEPSSINEHQINQTPSTSGQQTNQSLSINHQEISEDLSTNYQEINQTVSINEQQTK